MIKTKKDIVVLDANVLYPAPIRDFLLRLAEAGLFMPKWSEKIHEEWTRNLLLNRSDLKAPQLKKVQKAMDSAFPEANVKGFKKLINTLTLPDKDDRHVLATAIKCGANMIVTFNKKDFPLKATEFYDVAIKTPEEFTCLLLKTNFPEVLHAFLNQVYALKKPPQTKEQVLATLENCGLKESIAIIKEALR